MNYLLTGGTGLIGSMICQHLLAAGHTVTVLSRNRQKVHQRCGLDAIAINSLTEYGDTERLDVVINLAGAPIADARWSAQRKKELEQSRIQFTEGLIAWLQQRHKKPQCLISGSAIGWYGDNQAQVLTEHSDFNDDYAHQLCDQWEHAALAASRAGIRVCIVRTGLVLANKEGFLKRMLLPFKLGLGGPLGQGNQFMSWVHINDISRLFIFLSQRQDLSGIFNGTAPQPVTNKHFSHVLAKQLKRPCLLPMPEAVINILFGEMGQLLLGSQNVIPLRSQAAGFEFDYTDLTAALHNVLTHNPNGHS